MNRYIPLIVSLTLIPVRPCVGQSQSTQQRSFVGTWLLESIVDSLPDGTLSRWWGEHPTGMIMYDITGHMAVQFMRDPRPTVAVADSEVSSAQLRSAYEGYYAYFGRYELSSKGDSIAHFVEGSQRPNEVGTIYRRAVQIVGEQLVIRLRVAVAGGILSRTLVWRRAQ